MPRDEPQAASDARQLGERARGRSITAAKLRRLALEIVGLEGDTGPLMMKNLPSVCTPGEYQKSVPEINGLGTSGSQRF